MHKSRITYLADQQEAAESWCHSALLCNNTVQSNPFSAMLGCCSECKILVAGPYKATAKKVCPGMQDITLLPLSGLSVPMT